jgi:hypothetical protein
MIFFPYRFKNCSEMHKYKSVACKKVQFRPKMKDKIFVRKQLGHNGEIREIDTRSRGALSPGATTTRRQPTPWPAEEKTT